MLLALIAFLRSHVSQGWGHSSGATALKQKALSSNPNTDPSPKEKEEEGRVEGSGRRGRRGGGREAGEMLLIVNIIL
jgi:hypothetical protein